MSQPTDWTSALAIAVAALILGGLLVYFFSRRKTPAIVTDLERKDLLAKRDALVAQLRALDDDNVEERARLEAETADVLRRIDESRGVQPAGTAEVVAPRPAMNATVKGFLWGAGSFAALAGLAYFVMQQATPRQEGGMMTGSLPGQEQQQQQQQHPVVAQLEAAVKADPNNLQLRNDLAQAHFEQRNPMATFEHTQFVLQRAPEDSRALTLQALVRMEMGEDETARQMLERATKNDPKNLNGWVSLAFLHLHQNRQADAERAIAEASRQSPENRAQLEQVFREMQAQASGAPVDTAAGSELPAGHPPIDGAPAPAPGPAAAPDGRSVNVTLELDPQASQKGGIVFVLARNPMGGPPVAVKRLQVASFPVSLQLTSADSMMGQPLPDKFRLEARLDSDGDAMTRPATDPSAMQNDVAPGATVRLALK